MMLLFNSRKKKILDEITKGIKGHLIDVVKRGKEGRRRSKHTLMNFWRLLFSVYKKHTYKEENITVIISKTLHNKCNLKGNLKGVKYYGFFNC